MTIAEYQELTGVTVSDSDTAKMNAVLRRSQTRLETLLGYSLSKQKKWTEQGKVRFDGLLPFPSLPVSDIILSRLVEPDVTEGDIQLFNFDELDMHFRINPAKQVYRAKLVIPVSNDEFITVAELTHSTPYLNEAGLVTAITRSPYWFNWTWWPTVLTSDKRNLMLAIEGDFVNVCDANKYPDLAYLLADMVTYYSDPTYSIMGNIRSESIDSHSYSRASTGANPDLAAPEGQSSSRKVIEKYAGPAAFRKLVR